MLLLQSVDEAVKMRLMKKNQGRWQQRQRNSQFAAPRVALFVVYQISALRFCIYRKVEVINNDVSAIENLLIRRRLYGETRGRQ